MGTVKQAEITNGVCGYDTENRYAVLRVCVPRKSGAEDTVIVAAKIKENENIDAEAIARNMVAGRDIMATGILQKAINTESGHTAVFILAEQVATVAFLQRCWYKAYEGHNRVKVFPLDDSGNYAKLASYFIKYTDTHRTEADGALQGKRWNCSKNLVRPEPEIRIISDRAWFKSEPKAIKGYYVDKDSVSKGVHSPEYYGYGYMRYTLVKLE